MLQKVVCPEGHKSTIPNEELGEFAQIPANADGSIPVTHEQCTTCMNRARSMAMEMVRYGTLGLM